MNRVAGTFVSDTKAVSSITNKTISPNIGTVCCMTSKMGTSPIFGGQAARGGDENADQAGSCIGQEHFRDIPFREFRE